MRTIRSSEIGNYLYCRRAWWYRKTGVPSENQAELVAGTDLHRQHGRKVLIASLTRNLGLFFLLTATLLFVIYCAWQAL